MEFIKKDKKFMILLKKYKKHEKNKNFIEFN